MSRDVRLALMAQPAYTAVVHPARDTPSTQRASRVIPASFARTSVTSSTGVKRNPNSSSSAMVNPDDGYHSDTCRPDWNNEAIPASPNHDPR